MIWSSSLPGDIWWVWRSWLARQIVVLEIVGSSPITHPFFMQTYSLRAVNLMGYRQAVKAQHFDCCIVGSIPTSPVHGTLAQMVEHLTFNQVVGGSSPPCLTFSYFLFPFFCGGTILLRRRALRVSNALPFFAAMAELADAADLGSVGIPVQVQILLAALFFS